ncbi:MAG: hydroxymethylbilane synthase [Bryobacteraceae bacterium]
MLVIGSRGSKLALWQANHVKAALEALGEECRIEIIKTTGDMITHVPMKEVGSKGIFTKEIEEALLDGRIDLAVHSLKDMPTQLPQGLEITSTPERQDARDVLIGRKLAELPAGARVGTGSLRRIAQLRAMRPDLLVEGIRGNVDTRIRKLDEGEYHAIVLAAAGLKRLGLANRIDEFLPVESMCPAVGQGALAIETRLDDGPGMQASRKLDHADTRAAITAERAVLAKLGGGCEVPIGAYGSVADHSLHLRAIVISPDGQRIVRQEVEGPSSQAFEIGSSMAEKLLSAGAGAILEAVYG